MSTLRFLQFSDLHLGRGFGGPPFSLDDSQEETLRSDRLTVLESIVEHVRSENVEVVFLPGDLFEEHRLRKRETRRLRSAIEQLRPVPVVVAPGNHDYYSPLSWYHPDVMKQHGLDPWPEHLHVFTDPHFETIDVPGLDGLRVTGIAHPSNECRDEHLLQENVITERGDLNVLILHGSLNPSPSPGKVNTHPFTREELLNQNVEYAALGHYHDEQLVEEDGFLRAAYAGAPMGVTVSDTGNRSVLLGTLTGEGVDRKSVERRSVHPRAIHDLDWSPGVDPSPEDAGKHLEERFDETGVAEEDLVRVRVTGRRPPASLLRSDPFESLRDRFFHVRFDLSGTSLPVDLQVADDGDVPERTSEGRFVREMRERIEDARSNEEQKIAEKALRIGVEAFQNEEVDTGNVF